MPEISEVARVVHYLRNHLLNKTISKVTANHDDIVFGKVGTSAAEFEKQMKGKKVVDVGQQGKYFWMIMSSPPHPVIHFGMSGWLKIKGEHTYYYRKKENEPVDEWPPKYLKFLLEAKGDDDDGIKEAAFVDARRLARVRLVNCDGKEIRKTSPLKENGPDPVVDKDLVSLGWLTEKCKKKKVAIKAMLLDQAVISGIGNWVGDEVLYHAKIHPEQYANTLKDSQINQLHESIHYVCGTACELLGDSDQFPEEWLFKHRWGKGKKSGTKTLPNGNKIEFLTVGGRTSAVVPAVQKKTGQVAGDIESTEDANGPAEEEEEEEEPIKKSSKKRKAEVVEDDETEPEAEAPTKKTPVKRGKANGAKTEATAEVNGTGSKKTSTPGGKNKIVKDEHADQGSEEQKKLPSREKKAKNVKGEDVKPDVTTNVGKGKKATADMSVTNETTEDDSGRRRSGRLRK